ncbi:hypothetical protein F751_0043 [Auxenochlorella protothecoides]|uniref:Uncharacterized protein n=1 Tax=Auxenochlorella protothecoides TaxID=3075 RepID=A0A087S9N7_AUXPR|nr:hypothetical protein F751_0043 [Auxenochlorella protothecoides]KFM22441.1 hypothetical protein F751_0043 [Auxenochlorella protothecoides]
MAAEAECAAARWHMAPPQVGQPHSLMSGVRTLPVSVCEVSPKVHPTPLRPTPAAHLAAKGLRPGCSRRVEVGVRDDHRADTPEGLDVRHGRL